jgi:uncharacterized protein YdaU (DUF1376 family)
MYYYQFNIGDYVSSTQHLDDTEDLAYRRMLDIYYSKELPLPKDEKDIARLIRMRTHSESIATVLREFFTLRRDGYHCERADKEIFAFQDKSDKARKSAEARWNKNKDLPSKVDDANALRPECEGNAKHKTLNTKHKTVNNIHQQIADSWNEIFKDDLSLVSKITPKRKAAINGCIAEMKGTGNDFLLLETWTNLFIYAKGIPFLMGANDRGWTMSFDFITTKSKLIKLIEGEY